MLIFTQAPINCYINDAVVVAVCSLNIFLLSMMELLCSNSCVKRVSQHISLKHLSRNNQYLSLSFEILLQESEIAELAKNSGDSSQKMVYLNEQLREKDR